MSIKQSILVVFFYISFSSVFGQVSLKAELAGGYSSYKMEEMKSFMAQLMNQTEAPMIMTDDFPGYFTFGADVHLSCWNKVDFGIIYRYHNTGGRIHAADYSGVVGVDMLAMAQIVGPFVRIYMVNTKIFKLKAMTSTTAYFSEIDVKTYEHIAPIDETDQRGFSATSIGIDVWIEPSLQVTDRFSVGVRAGYGLSTKAEMEIVWKPNGNNSNVDPVYLNAQWSGFRSEAFVGFKVF